MAIEMVLVIVVDLVDGLVVDLVDDLEVGLEDDLEAEVVPAIILTAKKASVGITKKALETIILSLIGATITIPLKTATREILVTNQMVIVILPTRTTGLALIVIQGGQAIDLIETVAKTEEIAEF